ncbi:MAG: TonB-dependent receptor plug domain-containing protein, partial [Bacteroidota bacterium]
AVSTIEAEAIESRPEADIVRTINGKVPGVQIVGNSGATGSGTNFFIRSKSSINGNNQPLFVVDGVPFNIGTNTIDNSGVGNTVTSSRFLDLDPNMIEKVQVLRGLNASVLYGQAGRNGVVIITTKNGTSGQFASSNYFVRAEAERERQFEERRALMREKTIREMGFSTPYLEELQQAIGKEDMYRLYLIQREAYKNLPSYFIDVFDYFKNVNADYAGRVLSNVIEMDNDNYELLRVYAYKMEEQGDFETAAFIYRQVLKLRSEDAQSYRDLALVLAETGEPNEAIELLMKVLDPDFKSTNGFRNLEKLRPIIINEIANIVRTKSPTQLPEKFPRGYKRTKELDMRIVIDWNHNDTDIDLHVVDPNLEECYFGNRSTSMGGTMSEDMTTGFGPEEFALEDAGTGSYYVKIDYFGDNYQKVENPTFMKVSIFENYGTPEQQRRIRVMRLSEDSDETLVERIALL